MTSADIAATRRKAPASAATSNSSTGAESKVQSPESRVQSPKSKVQTRDSTLESPQQASSKQQASPFAAHIATSRQTPTRPQECQATGLQMFGLGTTRTMHSAPRYRGRRLYRMLSYCAPFASKHFHPHNPNSVGTPRAQDTAIATSTSAPRCKPTC